MLVIPAIDLKDGHCVRLKQGEMDSATIFSENPAEMARHWVEQGGRRLHLVDLNGAFAGKPVNGEAIRAIVKEMGTEIPVQLGGGIRDLATIEAWLAKWLRKMAAADRKPSAEDRWARMAARAQTPEGMARQEAKTRAYLEQLSPEDRKKWGLDELYPDIGRDDGQSDDRQSDV